MAILLMPALDNATRAALYAPRSSPHISMAALNSVTFVFLLEAPLRVGGHVHMHAIEREMRAGGPRYWAQDELPHLSFQEG